MARNVHGGFSEKNLKFFYKQFYVKKRGFCGFYFGLKSLFWPKMPQEIAKKLKNQKSGFATSCVFLKETTWPNIKKKYDSNVELLKFWCFFKELK